MPDDPLPARTQEPDQFAERQKIEDTLLPLFRAVAKGDSPEMVATYAAAVVSGASASPREALTFARSIIRRVIEDWPYQPPEVIEGEREQFRKWLAASPVDPRPDESEER